MLDVRDDPSLVREMALVGCTGILLGNLGIPPPPGINPCAGRQRKGERRPRPES